MEFINRMRKDKKGFTLVEIIVVLVILAILAAFMIPSMLGFIGDARGKAYTAEAREVYVAAQSTATELSAKTGITDGSLSTALSSPAVATEKKATPAGTSDAAKASAQMNQYIGTDLDIFDGAVPTDATTVTSSKIKATDSAWKITVGTGTAATTTTAKVNTIDYVKNGYKVTITDGGATVIKLK